ncbi:fumarylacetoacetate hydrolase family protein [Parasphingopyxis marina]|uniref:Fumarylacetoacetate hydrolase family protein n=1 Tax=Parasphingopyxis marina TaxID=2761622 RepID=A0A842I248_9SPHN|nr:fumarylacetoacetate hydrolase family protein [Parasphingopyxis marina]MBC2778881.1 fumarylacetoacetate hydrolase family protein [Parasphingopyxis marina]
MKLVSFEYQGRPGWGIAEEQGLRDMSAALPGIASLKALLAADALDAAREAAASAPSLAMDAVTLLPVIPDPSKIICCGLNYDEHRIESNNPERGHPTLFVRFADSQAAHGARVEHPPETTKLDYEAELAVVIGHGGRRIARDAAWSHVAGYACYNDISVRDWQKHSSQMTPGKNFPTTGSFGPWLVTRDEIDDLASLAIRSRLNGKVMQDAHLGDMIFDIPQLIEYISTFTPLSPGDVILTGTPGGVGLRRDPPVFMKPGDRIEVEIEKIGLLANPIV